MKEFFLKVISIQKVAYMLSSNHHLSVYTNLMTVLNKEDWQTESMKHELRVTTHNTILSLSTSL